MSVNYLNVHHLRNEALDKMPEIVVSLYKLLKEKVPNDFSENEIMTILFSLFGTVLEPKFEFIFKNGCTFDIMKKEIKTLCKELEINLTEMANIIHLRQHGHSV